MVVAGLGQLGRTLIQLALSRRFEVIGLDPHREHCDDVARDLGILVINDDPTTMDALINAGVRDADVVIFALGDDSRNLMGSILAKQLGAKSVISVVSNPERTEAFTREGIRVLDTTAILAQQLHAMILSVEFPQIKYWFNLNQDLSLMGIKLGLESKFIHKELRDLELSDAALVGIKRNEKLIIDPKAKLEPEDVLLLVGTTKNLRKLLDQL